MHKKINAFYLIYVSKFRLRVNQLTATGGNPIGEISVNMDAALQLNWEQNVMTYYNYRLLVPIGYNQEF